MISHLNESITLKKCLIGATILASLLFAMHSTNEGWIEKVTFVYLFGLAGIYYFSVMTIPYLYKNYISKELISSLKRLIELISTNELPMDINRTEDIERLSGVAKEITVATKKLTDLDSFEKEVALNMQAAIVITDMETKILYSTKQFSELFLIESATGHNLDDLIRGNTNSTNPFNDNKLISKTNIDKSISLYHMTTRVVDSGSEQHKIYEFQDVTEVADLKQKLEFKVKVDGLTSLCTRAYFTETIERIISTPSPSEDHYLALVDINDFKILNDSAGHDIGDLILMELADIIREYTDDDDISGRMSGDEFVIFFKNKSLDHVEKRLGDLYTAIKDHRILHFDTKIGVSVSIGVTKAQWSKDGSGVRTLFQQADLAVIAAKKNGFIFTVYDHNNADIIFYREAPLWINRIKNSISHDTFEIFVQEIQPFSNEKSLHLEVLLRMQNGQGGHYPPNKFFDVAEKFNLTKPIDEWVVINTFKKIIDGTLSDCKVSINLSADTIKDRNAVEKIIHYADYYKMDTTKIVFEITETMEIDDLNTAISNINSLRLRGFSIALDDFGSGFSTFKYIQNIPADYLKIDGIFVKNAVMCKRDRAIVANIVNTAHDLNMHCVAEFVEDESTMELMDDLGVDYIQGYHVHKPCPAQQWKESKRDLVKKVA